MTAVITSQSAHWCGSPADGDAEAEAEEFILGGGTDLPLGRRVVIVEDNAFVSLEFDQALSEAGYQVLATAVSAAEAIDACESEPPDFVLMDVRLLGDADGVDAAIELHRRFGLRSVFVTANADMAMRDRAAAARPIAWFSKPLSGERLASELARLRP